jgi:hypothetical protein
MSGPNLKIGSSLTLSRLIRKGCNGINYPESVITALTDHAIAIERFRANPWASQRTFETPLKDLHRFVETFLSPLTIESAVLRTDQIVFEPQDLLALAEKYSIHVENQWEFALRADGKSFVAELLEAVLGDWADFVFVPSPEIFAIYADHDEFITFYAQDKSQLTAVISPLLAEGFKSIPDYVRPSGGKIWK